MKKDARGIKNDARGIKKNARGGKNYKKHYLIHLRNHCIMLLVISLSIYAYILYMLNNIIMELNLFDSFPKNTYAVPLNSSLINQHMPTTKFFFPNQPEIEKFK